MCICIYFFFLLHICTAGLALLATNFRGLRPHHQSLLALSSFNRVFLISEQNTNIQSCISQFWQNWQRRSPRGKIRTTWTLQADIFSCLYKSNDDDGEWELHFEDERQRRRVPNMHLGQPGPHQVGGCGTWQYAFVKSKSSWYCVLKLWWYSFSKFRWYSYNRWAAVVHDSTLP